MTTNKLRELAKKAESGHWFEVDDLQYFHIRNVDAAFIAATTPETVLALLDDHEALQAERDHYKNTIKEVTARNFVERWRNSATDKELEQYLSSGISQLENEHRKQIEALQSECERLRKYIQMMIDQTTPLVPDPDHPGWSRRIQLDEVIAERDQLRTECEQLRKDAEFGRSVLSKREPGKAYGCHCDLEEGMEPDGCVIDSGERHNCIYANDISVKEQCSYWRVIATDAAMHDGQP